MHELIQTLFAYHSWATARLVEAMRELSPEEYRTLEASGHGSVHDTFVHYVNVPWGWFSWFDGSLPVEEAYALPATAEDPGSLEEAVERWRRVDEQARSCLDDLDDEALAEVWTWELPNGEDVGLPLWQLVTQVANHQTHTRAQIVAAIRRAGHDPGVYEFLAFAMERGGS